MKDKIKSVITDLFENAPESQEVQELQEEMISNAEEKYEELIQRGFTEEQAYTMVMGSIGDIQELIAEIAQTEEGESTKDSAKNEYWEKQCEYWKWQGENFSKTAKKFGQQMEEQANNLGQQAKEAMAAFMNSSMFETMSSSFKQIISDIGVNFQNDDGLYKDMQICNERKFAPDGIASINMELQNSPIDVDVQLTMEPEILIQELYNKDPQENQLLEYTVSGKQLKIQYGPKLIGFPRRGVVRVFLPESFAGKLEELKILTASGDVTLEDLGADKQVIKTVSGDISGACSIGDVNLSTVSGDIAFESIEGEVTIHTVSGDVKAGKIAGKANVNTTSGDVKVKEFQGDGVFRSVSGDISCNATKTGEKLEVGTASGDVEIKLPEDTSVQMTLKTAS
ncbi:MAG: DUF4097 family beta strand repeat protein, partial [Lachnospiraceae bacterium]|nr:DUF4097 family beta strand repeat protein [Lachnospiraceae bacterium]